MKNIIGGFIIAMFAVCLALPSLVQAGAEGDAAAGSFKFLLDDGETRFVEFKANELADGSADICALEEDDEEFTHRALLNCPHFLGDPQSSL